MKVILLQQIPKVGKKGDVVEVSDGYAANALFPAKKAIPATEKNLAARDRKNASRKDMQALEQGLLEAAIRALPNTTVTIPMKANEKGHLFSKVDASNIAQALMQHRISLSEKNILLKEPIKLLGVYEVGIAEKGYKGTIVVSVVQEK